jgi:HPt (histidine-containing phosphotransfer) domain-containing protein
MVTSNHPDNAAFDISVLLQLQDADTIRLIAEVFETTVPENLALLKTAAEQQDWDTAHFLAHKLKSSLAVIRIHEVYEQLSQVETLAKERQQLETIAALLERSRLKYEAVMPLISLQIQQHLAAPETRPL